MLSTLRLADRGSAGVLIQLLPMGHVSVQYFALLCAVLSFAASVITAVVGWRRQGASGPGTKPRHSVAFGHMSALLLGVAAAIIQTVALSMRIICVSLEIVQGYPVVAQSGFGFGPSGLWGLGFLLASNVVSLTSTRDARLVTCLLWTGVMTALWACLLMPSFTITAPGGFERTGATLWVLISLSTILTAAALLGGRPADRQIGRMVSGDAEASANQTAQVPGLSASCSMLAMGIGFLVCYHLLVPIRTVGGGYRGSALLATGSAALAAGACLILLKRGFSGHLADASVGLASLGLCGAATLFVPSRVTVLAERYPMVFNAMIVGLACATALWTWLAEVWRQRPGGREGWTTAGRLIPHAKRFAFLSAALALVAGVLMTFWPRLPGIATMDHSYGRVTAGFAANLFLLLVMLWSSRRLRRLTFHVLTLLAVASTAGFLTMRMIPFASRLG